MSSIHTFSFELTSSEQSAICGCSAKPNNALKTLVPPLRKKSLQSKSFLRVAADTNVSRELSNKPNVRRKGGSAFGLPGMLRAFQRTQKGRFYTHTFIINVFSGQVNPRREKKHKFRKKNYKMYVMPSSRCARIKFALLSSRQTFRNASFCRIRAENHDNFACRGGL